MSSAFTAAIDDIFADPHMAMAGIWRTGGTGDGAPVRVIVRRAKEEPGLPGSRVRQTPMLLDVRLSEVAAPALGDTVELADGRVLTIVEFGPQSASLLIQTCEVAVVE